MEDQLDLLLINPGGRERIYQSLGDQLTAVEPPLWCRLIGGFARDKGHSIAIIDAEAENLSPAQLAQAVAARKPRLVAMVVFGHQPSASTQQMVGARDACAALKEAEPDCPILIIGGHVSALPEQTLREEPVDYVCKGEGPITVVQLLAAIEKGAGPEDLEAVEGLVWRLGDEIKINGSATLISDLTTELHGNVWDLLPMERYRAHNWQCFEDLSKRQPYASIYTSLGCPYKCSFCCINAPFDVNRYRMRTPESVVAEIDHLVATYGVRTYKFIDEMFVLNERHVMAICDLLIERDYDLNIWAYARVDTVKPHMLDKLRRAGFKWLALGIESGSKHVRDGALKALRSNEIVDIVRKIQMADIHVIGNYIFGLPDDTHESMLETLQLALDLNCEFANFYSAMAYPGSPLYVQAVKNNWPLPDSWSGYSQHSFDCKPLPTDTVAAAEVLRFRDQAFMTYFKSARYLEMVTQRFGWDTRRHIEEMAKKDLPRALFETTRAEPEMPRGAFTSDRQQMTGGFGIVA